MDQWLNRLKEWKEKILFAIVLLVTIPILLTGLKTTFGESISDIDAAQRQASIQASGVEQAQAIKVLEKLEKPSDFNPVQLDNLRVDKPFYDDGQKFKVPEGKGSGWSLSQETYDRLPPLQLSVPGYSNLPDYDLPAGPHPDLSHAGGYIPRDPRGVSLTTETSSEFD
ncbi:MAG: hypothetical protein KDB82_10050 [Planctomycetes bacterium]|nr:hypothetical protein [Planctomycetota bacterium]